MESLPCSYLPSLPFYKMLKNPTDAEVINIISQVLGEFFDDEFEFRCLKLNLDTDKNSERRNQLNILVDFPKLYVQQLTNMILP